MWKKEADDRISEHRQRDIVINVTNSERKPIAGIEVEIKQIRHEFAFGSAMNDQVLFNQQYADFFVKYFNWAVFENEAKWYANEPERGKINYEKADAMLNFADRHQLPVRGHALFWEVEDANPSWLRPLPNHEVYEAMKNRLEHAGNHFKGRFRHWDVNNEMMHGSFFKDRFGKNIWKWMYEETKKIDPQALLFVNDYNVISYGEHHAYKAHINELRQLGAPIEAIGVQGHFEERVDPVIVKERLDVLAELGLPIWVTEYDSVHPDPNRRADNLEALYRVAFSHPAVKGVLMWGFWAGAHWRGEHAAIVNYDWSLNEAGRRYEKLLNEWTTQRVEKTDANGNVKCPAFHGTYEIRIGKESKMLKRQTIELDSNEQTPLQLDVILPQEG
ncbi:endo-1,4-beta-xylanase [Bacillus safensis]|nr:endo-1,4-beta-xylanase [Bacillus safensis]MCM2988171.1 endo-1,4-beta-xylanase [Bacillus safensis]